MKKSLILAVFLVLLISISGCKDKKDTKKALEEIRTGTEGITINFLPNAPPDKIHVEQGASAESNTFDVVVELRNKGSYPQPEDDDAKRGFGNVYISGYDREIITITPKDNADINGKTLEGKSTINPNGGFDTITFNGVVDTNKLNVEKYEPTLLATACYKYETVAGPSVCIDPNPYSTVKEKKVCNVQDTTLSNQGAPIAVTRIDEEALASRTQFKITIKNVGNGDVLKQEALNKCDANPSGEKITREDVDKVKLDWVKISDKPLNCRPFVEGETKESGLIRLINGEGFIICDYHKSQYQTSNTAFTTPISIHLSYGYRNTAEKKIQINREIKSNI